MTYSDDLAGRHAFMHIAWTLLGITTWVNGLSPSPPYWKHGKTTVVNRGWKSYGYGS